VTTPKHERDKPLPYYRWYVQDYRGSRNVQRLPWQARGIYRELLDEAWDKGSIPDDVAALAVIADCPEAVMAQEWPAIRRLFTEDGEGRMYSPRLDLERTAADRERIARVEAGRKGGLAKASNARAAPSSGSGPLASSSSSSKEQSKSSSTYAPPAARPSGAASVGVCPECERAEPKHHDECPLRPASPADIAAITANLKLMGARR